MEPEIKITLSKKLNLHIIDGVGSMSIYWQGVSDSNNAEAEAFI